jgi:hypothetical protein
MNNKQTIKQILKEGTEDTITRIAVFDFDGTLVNTPMPDTGKAEYKEKTGNDWPYMGWWGRGESLDMDIFDMPTIPSVKAAYEQERQNPNTLVVMLTGRLPKHHDLVKKILDSKGFRFDVYEYNNGGQTLQSKIKSMTELLNQYPNVKSLSMWDDRLEHIDAFKAWGNSLKGIDYNITVVDGNHHD